MTKNTFSLHILKDETTSYKSYTYVIIDNKTLETGIIDPACEKEKLETLIQDKGLKPKYILLTHTHSDHIRQVEWLYKHYQMQVCLSEIEAHFYDYYMPSMKLLDDEEKIQIGNTSIRCIHTAGHSKGSMCYWVGNKLFTGDTLFIEGCGVCTGIGGDVEEMYNTIQHLKNIILKETEIYPGHRYDAYPGETFAQMFEKNIYLLLDAKEDFVNFRMRKNQGNILKFK
ncbi:MBL fold metallo-hydrolase [Cellulosilyticum ruminicola]|uniref:MBL fold metallo-hydrolase n=1 Tax=Cellulosilyticum ruminicola TaxID=425254 RepID=UPI0006D126DA|nr:MBL fold metallo-hydrolase [Cellulosilyticum ruminicola]